MGMKNPLIMNMEPGEEETMKAMTSSSAKMAATCEQTSVTAGGGHPDFNNSNNDIKRRAAERARKATMNPDGSKKKRYADGSETGI